MVRVLALKSLLRLLKIQQVRIELVAFLVSSPREKRIGSHNPLS